MTHPSNTAPEPVPPGSLGRRTIPQEGSKHWPGTAGEMGRPQEGGVRGSRSRPVCGSGGIRGGPRDTPGEQACVARSGLAAHLARRGVPFKTVPISWPSSLSGNCSCHSPDGSKRGSAKHGPDRPTDRTDQDGSSSQHPTYGDDQGQQVTGCTAYHQRACLLGTNIEPFVSSHACAG